MDLRKLPILATFAFGAIPIFDFFINYKPINDASQALNKAWMPIIFGFALLLGIVNVVQTNARKVLRREAGWMYAVVLLAGLFSMGFFGFFGALGYFGGIGTRVDGAATPYFWMSVNIFTPLQSTMFGLLSFYIASSAYRAFRARNAAATLLLISGIFVMLGRIPFGDQLVSWIPGCEGFFSSITEWLMNYPNAAAQRGILIGSALGAASMALKVLLGVERSYLGGEEE